MIEQKEIVAVRFDGVTKRYKLFRSEKERLLSFFSKKIKYKTKISLNDISFEIKKGESVAFLERTVRVSRPFSR